MFLVSHDRRGMSFGNPHFLLFLPDVGNDMGGLLWRDMSNGWHISKVPVIRSHPITHRQMDRKIRVMGRPVNLADERRTLLRSLRVAAMTGGQLITKCFLSHDSTVSKSGGGR